MNFLSNVLDSVPVVGHVKGVVHYINGDKEAGDKAMYQASRTSAVLGAGAVGCLAGPGGAVAAAMYAGATTDAIASLAMDEPQGLVKGCQNIHEDIKSGKNPTTSIVSTGFQVAMDGVGGLGMGGVSKAAGQLSEQVVAKTFESAAKNTAAFGTAKIVGKQVTEQAVKKSIQAAAVQAEVILVAAHISRQAKERTKEEAREKKEQCEQLAKEQQAKEEKEKHAKEQSEQSAKQERHYQDREERDQHAKQQQKQRNASGSNSGSSQPPQKNNNKKDESANIDYVAIFMHILKKLLRRIFGNVESPVSRNIQQIFMNINETQNDYLERVIRRLHNSNILEDVVSIVINIFSEHFHYNISFPNALSFMEFVAVYFQEEIHDHTLRFRASEGERRKHNKSIPRMTCEELRASMISCVRGLADLVQRIVDEIKKLQNEIMAETAGSNAIHPNFRDSFSAVYHYYKHRHVKNLRNVKQTRGQQPAKLSVRQYYGLIRTGLKRLAISTDPDYLKLLDDQRKRFVRADVVLETFVRQIDVIILGRRIRIVVKFIGRDIILSSCFPIDNYDEGDDKLEVKKKFPH